MRTSKVPAASGNTPQVPTSAPSRVATQNAPPRSWYEPGSSRSSSSVAEPLPNSSPNSASTWVTSATTAGTSPAATGRMPFTPDP